MDGGSPMPWVQGTHPFLQVIVPDVNLLVTNVGNALVSNRLCMKSMWSLISGVSNLHTQLKYALQSCSLL